MNVEIAQRLAELRREKGYSQEELAEVIGLSRQAVSKWERAESSPDTGNLIALAKLYGVTLDELLQIDADIDDDVRFEAKDRAASSDAKAQAAAEQASVAAAQAQVAAAEARVAQAKVAQSQAASMPVQAGPSVAPPTGEPYYQGQTPGQAYGQSQTPGHSPYAPGQASSQVPGHAQTPGQAYAQEQASSQVPGHAQTPGQVSGHSPYAQGTQYVQANHQPQPPAPSGVSVENKKSSPWLTFPYPILCVIVFLLLGFFMGAWHPGWVVFLTIPLYYWIAHIIENDPNYRK